MNKAKFRRGIRQAMELGTPAEELRAAFFLPTPGGASRSGSVDAEGVPFDPYADYEGPSGVYVRPLCALEYEDRPSVNLDWTQVLPSRVVVTLLDEEYAQVQGFEHVLIGGERYRYRNERLPLSMGGVGVHQFVVSAEDDS